MYSRLQKSEQSNWFTTYESDNLFRLSRPFLLASNIHGIRQLQVKKSTGQLRLSLKYILAVSTRCLWVQACEKCEISTLQTLMLCTWSAVGLKWSGMIRDVALEVVILGRHSHTPHTASVRLAHLAVSCLTSLLKQFSRNSTAKRFNYFAVVLFSGNAGTRHTWHEAILAYTADVIKLYYKLRLFTNTCTLPSYKNIHGIRQLSLYGIIVEPLSN